LVPVNFIETFALLLVLERRSALGPYAKAAAAGSAVVVERRIIVVRRV
jgi:hypothetical protein